MRIGVEVRSLRGKGGLRSHAHMLAGVLAKYRGNHLFIFYGDARTSFPFPCDDDFQFRQIGSSTNRIIWEQMSLGRAAHEDGVDLLHCTDATAPLRLKAPLVLSVHDMIYRNFPETQNLKAQIIYRLFVGASIKRSAEVIAASEHTKQEILKAFPRAPRIHVVPYPVDPIFLPDVSADEIRGVRSKYNLPERFLLFVGVVQKRKNLPALYRAFRALKDDGIFQGKIVVCGDASEAWRDASLVRTLAIEQDILFVGVIESSERRAFYRAASVFVFPSLYEGFGLPPLEAMACGTPVVAAKATSIPEVCGDAALLFDPASTDSLTSCLRDVLTDDDLRQDLIHKGKKRLEKFTLEIFGERIVQVYDGVA